MYALSKTLHPPTTVERSVYCNFFNNSQKNLVTAGVNQIRVYRLVAEVESKPVEKESHTTETKSAKQKLECVADYELCGNVSSIESISLVGAARDALLLCFEEAKLSLCDYDPDTDDLKTISLHYFEDADLENGCCQRGLHHSEVRVDPEGRCAVMLIYGTHLIVLPFRKESPSDEIDATSSASKSPIMSTYIIDLRTLDERVTNVVDIQFLHGYYEPTVLILYEPLPTWTCRVAVRKDTCSIVAISLNLQDKTHPIIWSHGNLPYDCLRTFPVPKPIGGVIVFAVNSLLYLNQSFPPYGVSLNSLTSFNTEFLLKPQEGVRMSLDCAQAEFIDNDKLVISLKGGELYVLTLVIDSMRAVRSFHLDKAAASVLTTCMCMCGDNYLFLGSRLGNSLLLRYQEKKPEASSSSDASPGEEQRKEKAEPPTKKRKDDLGDWIASDVSKLDDLDELEVYGRDSQAVESEDITQFMFEVCDSIINIGPCGQVEMGEPAFLSEEFSHQEDPDLELVTTSGYGKNGAISILQRQIRPQVVTTFELPGCTDVWTVLGSPDEQQGSDEKLAGSHAFLLLSRADSSMVLETGQEIMELDHSGFCTDAPTVHAANIGNGRYIVQVGPNAIWLLKGVERIQHLALDVSSPVVSCSLADPHVLLLCEDGQLLHLVLSVQGDDPTLSLLTTKLHQKSKVIAINLYRDTSGLFVVASSESEPSATTTTEATETTTPQQQTEEGVDDEDDLLYGDSDISAITSTWQKQESEKEEKKEEEEEEAEGADIQPTYWAVIIRATGNLELYSLPDWQLCFLVKNFATGNKLLIDSMQAADLSASFVAPERSTQEVPFVHEVMLHGFGVNGSQPLLMARVHDELYIYKVFSHVGSKAKGRLQVRFKRRSHGLIIRPRDREEKIPENKKWLRPFTDISGYSGVFICGSYPHWLIMTQRGTLRGHPMAIDGTIPCFTAFHNVNCPKGFLYFSSNEELRICVLPTHLSYDAPWPVRKVPLRCTPHFVVYHPDSKTYSVVSSQQVPCTQLVRVAGDGEKEIEAVQKDDRFVFPIMNKFNIQLFSPVSWEPIPNTRFDLEEWEHVMCIKTINLKSEGTLSGLKGYVVVGTNLNYNEDVSSRGKLTIYDVIDVVPEPGQPLTKNKIKVVYNKEQKGPVTALDGVQGFLVTAIGQKVYIWQLKDNDLAGIAFIDTQIYIHKMEALKNLIIIGDVCKSISVLRYQEDMKVLSLVSKDVRPLAVYGVAYLVDETSLAFIVADKLKNFLVYCYQPDLVQSQGGQRLIRKADINIGSLVNAFFRVKCRVSDPSTSKTDQSLAMKHITYYVTLDGSIGYLLPISESLYRRLYMLQKMLIQQVHQTAGLNPKAYRTCQTEFRQLINIQRNIIDGDLAWKYLALTSHDRAEMAKRIGTTSHQIEDDLLEIDRCTCHF